MNAEIRKALAEAREALRQCYDVQQHPADGNTQQDAAIHAINEALAQPASEAVPVATEAELLDRITYATAIFFSGNRTPDMSGDPRARLGSHQKRACEDAARAALDAIRSCLATPSVSAPPGWRLDVENAPKDRTIEACARLPHATAGFPQYVHWWPDSQSWRPLQYGADAPAVTIWAWRERPDWPDEPPAPQPQPGDGQ